jgi:hypothetical protein
VLRLHDLFGRAGCVAREVGFITAEKCDLYDWWLFVSAMHMKLDIYYSKNALVLFFLPFKY